MRTKTTLRIVLSGAVLAATMEVAPAAIPKKQPLGRYAQLWTKSPFTVPPVVVGPEKVEENPLEDYTLAGVCEMKGGWFVVLMNKKDRQDRIRIKPGEQNEKNFKIAKVENGSNYLDTKVEIQMPGNKTGWVEYDKKFIVLKKATPRVAATNNANQRKPPVPARPGQPRANTPNRPPIPQPNASRGNTNNAAARPTRVRRRVAPPPPSR